MPKEKTNANRLPPCDACKLRRVRCDPVPQPRSCPRCVSRGIICTTNISPRGRRKATSGRKIGEARLLFIDDQPANTSTTAEGVATAAHGSSFPTVRAESRIVDLEVSGELITHLLQLYAHVPRARVIPCNFLLSAFESSGRRLAYLSPSTQTLMLAMSAISSHISSHPVLFGPGPPPPALSTFLVRSLSLSSKALYEFGKRRAAACRTLTEMALEQAWRAKVLSRGDDEAMAACFLLQILEYRRGTSPKSHVWKAAYIAHLRRRLTHCREVGFDEFLNSESSTFLFFTSTPPMMAWPPRCQTTHPDPESFEPQARRDHQSWLQYQSPCNAGHAPENNTKLEEMRLRWSMQVMWETLTCAWQGEVCGYSLHDEALLCGPPPPSLPELIMQVKSESVPWWDTRGFINLVRPYAYHVSRLALSSYDWQMRRKSGLPFSFTRFSEHIEDVKHLHFLLSVAQARFVMTYSSVATKFQRSGNMPGPSGCPYQGHTPLSNMGRHMLNSMRSALGSVNIAILEDLQERVREANIVSGPTDPDIPMLELILCTLTRALMPYGMYIMRNALNGTYMAWLTQLGNEPFLFWCHFLLNATPVEDGGDAFTRSEKLVCLETMSEIIAVISWSWPGAFEHPLRGEIARTIEEIKFAQALSETLGIETLRLDSRSMFSNQSGSTESPNELYMFPAVLELPDIEAAMRDAGVMDMINGAQLEANSEYARWAATITPFTISSQETFLDGGVRSISSATAVDHGGTIGLPNNDDIGHGDGRRATSTFTPRPTGMQTQTPMAGIPVNTNRVPTQGYVYDADTSVWDAMGVHIGAATGQTDAWTMDTGDFDTSTDDSLWDLMVPADQPRFSCL